MNNEVKLKGLAGLAHLLSPGADWAYDDAARNVRDYVKEQTLALAAKDRDLAVLRDRIGELIAEKQEAYESGLEKDRDLADASHALMLANSNADAFKRVAEQRQQRIVELERHETLLMDRLDRINIAAHRHCERNTNTPQVQEIIDWSGGFAQIPTTTGASNG